MHLKRLSSKFTSLLFLLCLGLIAKAQNAPVDFEAGGNGADWTWTVFQNVTNPPLEFVANPDPVGINNSNTVAKFTALVGGAPFAGCETMHGSDIGTFTLNPLTSTIRIMVWKSVISNVGIKLVDAGAASLGEILVPNTVVGEWEELTFDFSFAEGIPYDQIVIFPDFTNRTCDNVIYFDNITFSEPGPEPNPNEPMEPAPDPTIDAADVISMFSNVYTDVNVDTWLTVWSSAVLDDIQIQGNDTKKYSSLDFAGVETVGANLIDATEMVYFHCDVWTPNMTTLRVKLVDFGADQAFGGGDDSEHEIVFGAPTQNEWVSLQIPLSNFTSLASTEHLAQLIFSGEPVGSGTLFVDNVYFSYDVPGCSDPLSCNFSPFADCSNESCVYPGCTYPIACNYDPLAGCEDGSCEFSSCTGCTYPFAPEYNPSATIDDGSCTDGCDECPGDLNDDLLVSTADLLVMLTYFGVDCTLE